MKITICMDTYTNVSLFLRLQISVVAAAADDAAADAAAFFFFFFFFSF